MDCATKYPVMLIHGVGFRDRKYLNYWGRIPAALEEHGAKIFYGHQDSWGSIEYNASVLKDNINRILTETNCDKINLIAHSKGGLEARYLISSLGMADKVASLTTVATPHHGSKTVDLLFRLPHGLFRFASVLVNSLFRKLGDKNPDFHKACRQFSTDYMKVFNEQNPDAPSVYYQSYGAVMKNPFSDLILFWSYLIVLLIEGKNDGLVTIKSAQWTNFQDILRGTTFRGVSHADVVNFRRMNLSKKPSKKGISDIREFYVGVVAELKRMGL